MDQVCVLSDLTRAGVRHWFVGLYFDIIPSCIWCLFMRNYSPRFGYLKTPVVYRVLLDRIYSSLLNEK